MRAKRQNNQLSLAFAAEGTGEARGAAAEGTEACTTTHAPERPAPAAGLMEEVCNRENLQQALRRVRGNKGRSSPI